MEEVPFDDRHVPRVEVDWERSAWWWYPLTRAIHPAMRMNALAVGLIAMLFSQVGLGFGDWLFAPSWQPVLRTSAQAPFGYSWRVVEWLGGLLQSLLSFQQFRIAELAFVTFELLWLTGTFALLGGVLARRSLVELGQRTVSAWGESSAIVFSRWPSFLWSTGMHLVGISLMLLPIMALGLLSRFGSLGATLGGVLLLLSFPLVFAVGRFALSAIVCFPLSVCAIAAEKRADAFEGFSRSNAYFFQRPVVVAVCLAVLFAIGSVGEQIVYWTISLGWWLIRAAYLYAGGASQPTSNAYILAGNWLAGALLAAYWFSFFWSGSAATYLILRKSVDNTELDELESPESSIERSVPEIPAVPPTASTITSSEAEKNPHEA